MSEDDRADEVCLESFDFGLFEDSLRTRELGRTFHYLNSCNSTQVEMDRMPQVKGTVVLSERQLHGIGRQGRSFESRMGSNLYFTLLLECQSLDILFRSTYITPIAICMGINELVKEMRNSTSMSDSDAVCMIKWPNDIVDSKTGLKIGGLLVDVIQNLAETNSPGISPTYWGKIGVGLNISTEPSEIDSELKEIATSLKIAMKRSLPGIQTCISRERLLGKILSNIEELYGIESLSNIIEMYERYNICINRPVEIMLRGNSVPTTRKRYDAIATGITDTGELIFVADGGTEHVLRFQNDNNPNQTSIKII